jgi:hypothetical protein
MTETTTPAPARTDRPKTRIGKPFTVGNSGRPRGLRDKRTRVGIEICDAMAAQAADVLRALLSSRSGRIRLEAARAILSWSWGLPKQSITLAGGIDDLAKALTAALQEARARRAALEAVRPVASLCTSAQGVPEAPAEPASEAE